VRTDCSEICFAYFNSAVDASCFHCFYLLFHFFQKKPSMTREGVSLILGTGSFIRKQILAEMGYTFCVMTADLDERAMGSRASAQDAPALVTLLAKAKADEIIRQIHLQHPEEAERRARLPPLLLTADSVATFEGQILEKPDSLAQAASFLHGYGSGTPLSIVSGICVTNLCSGAQLQVNGAGSGGSHF
jgi:predicted house-cleaning NTP pyrophosphatase (Maf/HAM1 superfamily)